MSNRKKHTALDVRRVREEIQATQEELAQMLGLSAKAVQSYEQGWRVPPPPIRHLLNVVLMAHRTGRNGRQAPCWQSLDCPAEARKKCRAYLTGQTSLCWLITGHKCRGQRLRSPVEKERTCRRCPVFQRLTGNNGRFWLPDAPQ